MIPVFQENTQVKFGCGFIWDDMFSGCCAEASQAETDCPEFATVVT